MPSPPITPIRYSATVCLLLLRVGVLDENRDALAAADARRGYAVAPAALVQFADEREDEPRPGGTERVAERDRAAVDVDLPPVELELLLAREVLRGERLVDLDE